MTAAVRRRNLWEFGAILVACLIGLAVFSRLVTDATDLWTLTRLQGRSQGSAEVLAIHLDSFAADLTQTAAALSQARGVRTRKESLLGQIIQRHPRLVRSLALVDASGEVVVGELPGGWAAQGFRNLLEQSAATGGLFWAAGPIADRQAGLLLAGVPLLGSAPWEGDRFLALVVCVESAELARLLVRSAVPEPRMITLLVETGSQRTLPVVEGPVSPGPVLFEEFFPGQDQQTLRSLMGDGVTPRQPVRALMMGEVTPALVGAASVEAAGKRWTVLSVFPHRDSRRQASPLIFGAAGVLAFLALFTSFLLVLRRQSEVLPPAERFDSGRKAVEPSRDSDHVPRPERTRDPELRLRGLNLMSANAPALRALGLASEAMAVDRDFLTFVAPEERTRVESFLRGLTTGERVPECFQTRLVTTIGERRVVDMHIGLDVGRGGAQEFVSWRDITSSQRAEALLRAVAQWVPAALVLLDSSGNVTWANEPFSVQSGFRVEHFSGGSILPMVVEEDRRRAVALFGRSRQDKPQEGLLRVRLRSGVLDLVAVRFVPVSAAGALFGVLVVAHRFASALWRGPADEKDAALVGQDVLLNSLSHQLNNELQSVFSALAALAGAGGLGAEERVRLEVLLGRAAGKARRLLLATRSGTGVLAPLKLCPLVERWAQAARQRISPGLRLLARFGCQSDRVLGDAAQIELFLDVALESSLAALRDGGGVVEVSVDELTDAPAVRLAITDTGGVTDHGTQPGEGSSLMPVRQTGRAVGEMVARRHGGSAGSKERAGIGYRLWLDLPVWTGSALPELPLRVPHGEGSILVADDEETIRRALAEVLIEQGYNVVEAVNGAEAADLVLSNPDKFSLVVLDLVMPVMDGRAALRRLREVLPGLPVLICTGYDPAGDPELSLVEVLIKPFSVEEFLNRVKQMLPADPEPNPESSATMEP